MKIDDIEIVKDLSAESDCQNGFLKLSRLHVRNHYNDGSQSATYNCDIITRTYTDAVAVCLYSIDKKTRRVHVILKEAIRVPIYLRKHKDLVLDDPRPYHSIIELVAGLIEDQDRGAGALQKRAAAEAKEEAGFTLNPKSIHSLGGETFASPGISDEKVYYCAAEVDPRQAGEILGDGGVMEEATVTKIFDLNKAIRMCRDGRIPDMKTEVGLLRLADRLGYIPQLDRFVFELPDELQQRYDSLGIKK